jgi:hypothetical protein
MPIATELLTAIPRLMQQCCEPEPMRYDNGRPFLFDGRLCATDCRILVWQPMKDFSPDLLASLAAGRGKIPNCRAIWEVMPKTTKPHALPETIREMCDGCGGEEYTECFSCHGLRYGLSEEPMQVGPVQIATQYAAILYEAGVRELRVGGKTDSLHFVLGRLEGVLMPLAG